MVKKNKHGSFVISLDFEMMWGLRDLYIPENYGQSHVKQVREVISSLLVLFKKYNVHATFATVGLILCQDKKEALNIMPKLKPSYANQQLSPYSDNYIQNIKDEYQNLYFAPDIVGQLKENDNIEIGSHTFCHYYCWAQGQTLEQFDVDIETFCNLSKKFGISNQSIVFPRNEVDDNYLSICAKYGISVYRGNARKFFAHKTNKVSILIQRICRLMNAYFKIGRHSVCEYNEINTKAACIDVPATRFLRPYSSRLHFLEKQRLRHIKDELEYAAKHQCLYHLWWHPHNFGANIEENLAFLEEILKKFVECRDNYGMQSYTMYEAAQYIKDLDL